MSLMGDPVVDMITLHPLFEGLEYDDVIKLRRLFTTKKLAGGELITKEGELDPFVHVLWRGAAKVTKANAGTEFEISTLGPGESVGEMKLTDGQPSSATVTASGAATIMSLSIARLSSEPAVAHIHKHILVNISRILAARLRSGNASMVGAMKRELVEAKARLQAGLVSVYMLLILGSYSLVVSALRELPPDLVPSQALLSPFVILGACVPMAIMMKRSPFSFAEYGVTLAGWPRHAIQAVLYSLPVMALLVLLKLALVTFLPGVRGVPVFDLGRLGGEPFSWSYWGLATAAYCAVSPFQEFFTRCGIQGSFHKFLPDDGKSVSWTAIILTNLAFSTAHTHIGFRFAMAALLPGLFWGWLYERQRSLVGVSVSHMLVGTWAISVLGLERFIAG